MTSTPTSSVLTRFQNAGAAGADGVAAGGYGVHGGQHFDGFAAQAQGLADLNFVEGDEGLVGARQTGKIGPDDIVEHMRLEGGDGAGQGVGANGLGQTAGHGVNHQRQGGDVIEVGVGEQHMAHTLHFVQREVAHAGAGVYQHIVVN
jgi:hypothetical protein